MFWDKAYTPSQNIEALLEKDNVKVEDILDDDDILQECKNQKRKLVQYLTHPDVIKRLIELTITEPSENLPTAERFKYANVACEVLTFGLPSLDAKLVENPEILQTLYSFLEQEPPLNPLLSSFFSKTFSMLISKKSEQDWFLYQKMCLQVLEFIKSRGNFLDLMFRHFDTPVIMDLLLQIIKEVQGGVKHNLYEWLTEQQLVERLINMLGQSEESEKHNNIAEFLSELIKNSRSMRQNEKENDSCQPAFVGIDPLLQVIEDEKTISLLLDVILRGEIKDSSIIAGINIVLTLVDESIVDEPASDTALQMIIDKEKENHEKIVSTVIRVIAPRLKEFHDILINPPNKLLCYHTSPPFGFTRLQVCRLFTVLLRTGNKDIIKEICETELFNTLLSLFKQYSWNNFLHGEVEKCLEYVFSTFDQNDNDKGFGLYNPSALQFFVIVNCKIISKLIDCWMYNKDVQSSNMGHRLGYMGHLIKIFKYITTCISNSDHICALIESNLNDNEELLKNWKLITNLENGELIKELELQNKMLADCNAHESTEYSLSLPKDVENENLCPEIFNLRSCIGDGDQNSLEKILGLNMINCFLQTPDNMMLHSERDFKVWDNSNLYNNDGEPLNITVNPWVTDPFSDNNASNSIREPCGWDDFSNNFADFNAHFDSFLSELEERPIEFSRSDATTTAKSSSCSSSSATEKQQQQQQQQQLTEYETNYNPSQSPSLEALNEFNCNNNDFEKCRFDDDGDDFDISFKNAKNLNVKFENINNDNDVDDDINNQNVNHDKCDNDKKTIKQEEEEEEVKEENNDDNNIKKNNDDSNEMNKMKDIINNTNSTNTKNNDKICQNFDNNDKKNIEEADFSDINTTTITSTTKNDTQTFNNSELKMIIDDKIENDDNGDDKIMKQSEEDEQKQEQRFIVSNGPVKKIEEPENDNDDDDEEEDIFSDCIANENENENSNAEGEECIMKENFENMCIKDENIVVENNNDKYESFESAESFSNSNSNSNSNSSLSSQNNDKIYDNDNVVEKNLSSIENLKIADATNTSTSTADAETAIAITITTNITPTTIITTNTNVNNDIPPETQENGPV